MTNPTYTVTTTPSNATVISAVFDDGRFFSIPTDPANSDYQAYLATLAANPAPTAQ